jgi:hypothetical protein
MEADDGIHGPELWRSDGSASGTFALVFEVPRDEIDVMSRLVHDGMSNAIELSVPLAVDVNVGPNWGELARVEFDVPAGAVHSVRGGESLLPPPRVQS